MAKSVPCVHRDPKSGLWYVQFRYKNKRGKSCRKKKCGFKTQTEAKNWMAEFKKLALRSDDISFESLVKVYFDSVEVKVKDSTMETKTHIVYMHILPFFKEYNLNEIDADLIEEWQLEIIKSNQFSDTYLYTIQAQLNAILNYAFKKNYISDNIVKRITNMGNSKASEMLIWELEEYNQFMKYAVQYPELYYPILLMYWSGIRLGEMMALKISSIDFVAGTLFVKQTYYRKRREDKYTTTKTDNSFRIIKLPQFVLEEMQEYVNSLYGRFPDDKLFYRSKGFYEKKFPMVANLAGVKTIRIHDLRHSHASNLIGMGVDIATVADRLGDTIKTVSDTYVHAIEKNKKDVANRLDDFYAKGD